MKLAPSPRGPFGLAIREVATGATVLATLSWLLMYVTVKSYESAGGATILKSLTGILHNPAIAALYGQPYALASAGGFTVWKSGGVMLCAASVWAALAATRVMRGAEDRGGWDLLTIGRVSRLRTYLATLAALVLACAWMGLFSAAGFFGGHVAAAPALAFGVELFVTSALFAIVGAFVSQLVAPRRVASSIAVGVVALTYVVRMVADGTTAARFLRWASPFGWAEEVHAFGDTRYWLLAVLALPVLVLAATVVLLGVRRDVGRAMLEPKDRVRQRERLLRSSWGVALRSRVVLITAWALGAAAMSGIFGFLVHAIVRFSRSSPKYVTLLRHYGFSVVTVKGFVAEIDLFAALAVVFFASSSLHAEYADESEGRLDAPLSTGASRLTWWSAAVLSTLVGAVIVALSSGVAMWAMARLSGATLTLGDSLGGVLNAALVVLPVVGVVTLLHGTWPRLATPVVGALAALSLITQLFGVALHWPNWVVDLSVFHHLAQVPAVGVAWTAAAMMALAGVVAFGVGLAAYARRDVG
jgi:ABC-2 type transport system permease protein